MNNTIVRYTLITLGLFFLSGCVTERNIALSEKFWQEKPHIVIAQYKAPEPGMVVSGEQGLLDMAITRAANNTLIKKLRQNDMTWYKELPHKFAQGMKSRSIKVEVDPSPITNKQSIFAKAQGNKLLALKLVAVGVRRKYSLGFISSGAPQTYCLLLGELIDPHNKDKPLWRSEIEVMQPIKEPWDQAPHFTNLLAAVEEATQAASSELLDSFFSGH